MLNRHDDISFRNFECDPVLMRGTTSTVNPATKLVDRYAVLQAHRLDRRAERAGDTTASQTRLLPRVLCGRRPCVYVSVPTSLPGIFKLRRAASTPPERNLGLDESRQRRDALKWVAPSERGLDGYHTAGFRAERPAPGWLTGPSSSFPFFLRPRRPSPSPSGKRTTSSLAHHSKIGHVMIHTTLVGGRAAAWTAVSRASPRGRARVDGHPRGVQPRGPLSSTQTRPRNRSPEVADGRASCACPHLDVPFLASSHVRLRKIERRAPPC